jgi:hypothetical protein
MTLEARFGGYFALAQRLFSLNAPGEMSSRTVDFGLPRQQLVNLVTVIRATAVSVVFYLQWVDG